MELIEDTKLDILLKLDYNEIIRQCMIDEYYKEICKKRSFWIMKVRQIRPSKRQAFFLKSEE